MRPFKFFLLILIVLLLIVQLIGGALFLRPVIAYEQGSEMAIVQNELVIIEDYLIGGALGESKNLGQLIEGEVYKLIERIQEKELDLIFLKSLEVDKQHKNFLCHIRTVKFLDENQGKLYISETILNLGDNYNEVERKNRMRGRCLKYFFQDLEKALAVSVYQNCGWEI